MKLDKPLFVVICDHKNGLYISETDVTRLDCVSVCKDLKAGQYSDPIFVLEMDLIAGTCRDATHDFKPLLDRSPDVD